LQQATTGVAHLVLVTVLDQQQRSRTQRHPPAGDTGGAGPRHDVEPLIGAAMAVAGTALRLAGRNDHLGGLRAAIAERDPEPSCESELPASHR
jgi:hypothetical protein